MAGESTRDHEHNSVERADRESAQQGQQTTGFEEQPALAGLPVNPAALLGDPRLKGRGNQPVKIAALQRMQQTCGNRAVQRFLQRSASRPAPGRIDGVEQRFLQRLASTGGGNTDTSGADDSVADRIRARAGGGAAIDARVQRRLEDGLGADLSGVRVHTDSEADDLSRSVDAVAFTSGQDIFFNSGAYDPGSQEGMRLLAHEAAHTVQQSQGPVAGTPTQGGISVSDPSDEYEKEAERAAENVVSNAATPDAVEPVQMMRARSASTPFQPVQRQAAPEGEQPGKTPEDAEVEEVEEVEEERQGTEPQPLQRAIMPSAGSPTDSPVNVQRKGDLNKKAQFSPQVSSSPGQHEAELNDDLEQQVKVTNAASAPKGTEFKWRWGRTDSKKVAPGAAPAAGAQATLKLKTKEVGSSSATAVVDYTGDFGGPGEEGGASKTTEPVQINVDAPKADFTEVIEPGGQGKGSERKANLVYKGDKLTLMADFTGINKPSAAGLTYGARPPGYPISLSMAWEGDTLTWKMTPRKPGNFKCEFWVKVPGMEQEIKHTWDIKVVMDFEDFIAACVQAQARAGQKIGAAEKRVHAAAKAYRTAFKAQQEILKNKAKEEELNRDLAMGALFAVLGGAAGGAAGAGIKKMLDGASKSVGGEAVTDMGKDLVKFSVRMIPKLGGSGGAGGKSPGAGGGKGPAVGDDPADILDGFGEQVGSDQATVNGALEDVVAAARKARDSGNFEGELDEDPLDLVDKGKIDDVASGWPSDKHPYSVQLWGAWFGQNAKHIRIWKRFPGDTQYYADIPGWLGDAAADMGVSTMSLVETYWGKDPSPPPGKGYPAPGPKF